MSVILRGGGSFTTVNLHQIWSGTQWFTHWRCPLRYILDIASSYSEELFRPQLLSRLVSFLPKQTTCMFMSRIVSRFFFILWWKGVCKNCVWATCMKIMGGVCFITHFTSDVLALIPSSEKIWAVAYAMLPFDSVLPSMKSMPLLVNIKLWLLSNPQWTAAFLKKYRLQPK